MVALLGYFGFRFQWYIAKVAGTLIESSGNINIDYLFHPNIVVFKFTPNQSTIATLSSSYFANLYHGYIHYDHIVPTLISHYNNCVHDRCSHYDKALSCSIGVLS